MLTDLESLKVNWLTLDKIKVEKLKYHSNREVQKVVE